MYLLVPTPSAKTTSDQPKVRTCLWFDGNGEQAAERANRATQAMLSMKKIDIAALEAAFRGE